MINTISYDYHKQVYATACLRFGKSKIKHKKRENKLGLLGEYYFELVNGDTWMGFFHYQKEHCEFVKV